MYAGDPPRRSASASPRAACRGSPASPVSWRPFRTSRASFRPPWVTREHTAVPTNAQRAGRERGIVNSAHTTSYMGRDILSSLGYGRWESLYAAHAHQVFAYASRHVGVDDAAPTWWRTRSWWHGAVWGRPGRRAPVALRGRPQRRQQRSPGGDPQGRVAVATGGGGVGVSHDYLAPAVEARADILAAMRLLPAQEREALMLVAWGDLQLRRPPPSWGARRERSRSAFTEGEDT